MRNASDTTHFWCLNNAGSQNRYRNVGKVKIEQDSSAHEEGAGQKFEKLLTFYNKINCQNNCNDAKQRIY